MGHCTVHLTRMSRKSVALHLPYHGETKPFHRLLSLLSFDPTSTSFFVSSTTPRICVHSETILPTTCPHFDSESECANSSTQPTPVITRKIVSECSCKASRNRLCHLWRGRLLSCDPRSYKYLVPSSITTTPVQSAIALPKNEPTCRFSSLTL